jgi:hypothetical protein
MPLDYEQIRQCRDELERELFRIADHDDCSRFHKESQRTTVLLLLIRSASLPNRCSLSYSPETLTDFILYCYCERLKRIGIWRTNFVLKAAQTKAAKWMNSGRRLDRRSGKAERCGNKACCAAPARKP